MSSRRKYGIGAYALSSIFAATGGYLLAFVQYRAPAWACGIFSSSNAAAWVQGVGTLLAVIGAALIAWCQRQQHVNDQVADADRRAHALAIQLVPLLDDESTQLRGLIRTRFGESWEEALKLVTEIHAARFNEIPSLLMQSIDDIHVLGHDGKVLLRVSSRVRRIAGVTSRLESQLRERAAHRGRREFDSALYLPILHELLRDQLRDIENALDSLVNAYDMRE